MLNKTIIRSKRFGIYVKRWDIFFSKQIGIVIHNILSQDVDLPHNHNRWNVSVVLWGFGKEELFDETGTKISERKLFPGRIIFRIHDVIHKVHSDGNLWTLFCQYQPNLDWGFYGDRFYSAKEYAKLPQADKFIKKLS